MNNKKFSPRGICPFLSATGNERSSNGIGCPSSNKSPTVVAEFDTIRWLDQPLIVFIKMNANNVKLVIIEL